MPFMAITKRAKAMGIQTFARVQKLPEPFKTHELEYLSIRDRYVQTVGRIAQYEEALKQAKVSGDKDHVKELGQKLHGLMASLQGEKLLVQSMCSRSYAEAFRFVASQLLTPEAKEVLNREVEALLGRAENEVRKVD